MLTMKILQLLCSRRYCPANIPQLHWSHRVRVTLRLAVYRQSVRLGAKPLEAHDQHFFFNWTLAISLFCNILSDERMGLSFTIAAGPRKRSHSRIRVPRDPWPYFTVSDSRLSQPGGSGPRIYILQEQVTQLYPQALGSFFVASYDPQGYGGGILIRLNTVQLHSSASCLEDNSLARTTQKTQPLYCCRGV
jgi:hypothetical protein